MRVNYMFGADVAPQISERECPYCQRIVDDGREGWCFECFEQWYDGDLSREDSCDPVKVANWVRAKHALPPLTDAQIQKIVDYQQRR